MQFFGITKCESIILKKKIHDKIVLLVKTRLNSIEVLTSKNLSHSNINHDEFVSVNNVLREHDDTKKSITDFNLFIKQCYLIVWGVEKMQKVKTNAFFKMCCV